MIEPTVPLQFSSQRQAVSSPRSTNQEDLQKLVKGITLVRRLNQTKAFAPFYEGDVHPGPQMQSDKEMVEFIRNHLQSMYHYVGTCKMGHDDNYYTKKSLAKYKITVMTLLMTMTVICVLI